MSEMHDGPSHDSSAIVDAQATVKPTLGLVATEADTDHVVREILRARRHGHRVVITAERSDCEALEFARALGATVVEPAADCADTTAPIERLATAARGEGFPGLLYHDDPALRVDYGASCAALSESGKYSVDARIEPPVETDATVLVGIPAYNEAGTIVPVVEAALDHADDVLVVDDGSTDETAELARNAGAGVIEHETNKGYGGALKTLFEQANVCRTDHLVVLDADGQHDTNDIPSLVEAQQETEAEIIVGCRFGDDTDTTMPLYRRAGLGVVNFLTNISLHIAQSGSQLRDTQSGFRVYNSSAIQSLADGGDIGDHMSASTDILYHAYANGFDVEEVPTTIDYEVENCSNHGPIHHGVVLVMNILRTVERERPITTLGIPGLVCMLAGLSIAYWVFYEYLQSGAFPVGPTIVASVASVLGIFTSFTAIILHSLAVYHK